MINKKGQALVEFVLIIPILIMIIFSIVDFGRIMIKKNEIESEISTIISYLNDGETISEVENRYSSSNYSIVLILNDNKLTIKVSSDVDIITPGLNRVLGNPFKASSKRVILYENEQ